MAGKLFYGVGRRNIIPDVPVSLAGYFNIRMWENIADDIEVRVLVFRQDKQYCAIVQFDLITVSPELLEAFYTVLHSMNDNIFETAKLIW